MNGENNCFFTEKYHACKLSQTAQYRLDFYLLCIRNICVHNKTQHPIRKLPT